MNKDLWQINPSLSLLALVPASCFGVEKIEVISKILSELNRQCTANQDVELTVLINNGWQNEENQKEAMIKMAQGRYYMFIDIKNNISKTLIDDILEYIAVLKEKSIKKKHMDEAKEMKSSTKAVGITSEMSGGEIYGLPESFVVHYIHPQSESDQPTTNLAFNLLVEENIPKPEDKNSCCGDAAIYSIFKKNAEGLIYPNPKYDFEIDKKNACLSKPIYQKNLNK